MESKFLFTSLQRKLFKKEKKMKTLNKSNNKLLCGVCAGVAEFFNIDPTIIRLVMVIITIVSWGTGIIAYIIAAIIIPNKVENNFDDNLKSANVNDSAKNEKDESNQSSHASKKTPNSEDEFNDYFKK